MTNCPRCHFEHNDPEACPNCGLNIKEDSTEATFVQSWGTAPDRLVKGGFGSTAHTPEEPVVLYITGFDTPLSVKVMKEITIGRARGKEGDPDVDLTPFDAKVKGVSRMHAKLRAGNGILQLIDIGSTNGTFVNERQLTKDTPYILRNGDSFRLGQVVVNIYFK